MNSNRLVAGNAITLAEMLAARDRRAQRQQTWLARWGLPLVSLTLVWPGPVKDSAAGQRTMAAALEAFTQAARTFSWSLPGHQVFMLPTGPEALWSVAAPADQVKRATVALEDQHPLGRLWDIDVFSPREGLLNRARFGHPGRRCLLCGEPAHACARSRRHPLPLLLQAIEDKIDDYFNRPQT